MSFWRNDPVVGNPTPVQSQPTGPYRIPDPEGDAVRARQEAEAASQAQSRSISDRRTQQMIEQGDIGQIPAGYRLKPDGSLERIPGGPATIGRTLRQADATQLENHLSTFEAMDRALGGFNDDYAGNTITGGLESTIQGAFGGFGTPGQRDWWANFKSTDNMIRNDLFGSALTATEKAAYEATTISPNMDPAEIRSNIARRREILSTSLSRRVGRLRAAGFNGEEIDAALGTYAGDFGAGEAEEGQQEDDSAAIAGSGSNGIPGPTVLPRASGTQGSGNSGSNGVSDAGTGMRRVPEFRGIAQEVPQLLQQGASTDEIVAHLQGRYSSVGASVSPDQRAFIDRMVGRMRADPRTPAASLADNWAMLEMLPSGDGESTVLGSVADSMPGAAVIGAADGLSLGYLDEAIGATGGDGAAAEAVLNATQDEYTGSYIAGQLLAGLVIPTGSQGAALRAGTEALRAGRTMQEARALAAAAARNRMAGEGAAIGAGYGSGSANGDLGDRIEGAGVGAALGAAGGAAIGQTAARFATRPRALPNNGSEVYAAAQRQGIEPFVPDVGGSATRRVAAGLEQTVTGSGPIRAAADRANDTGAAALERIASRAGQSLGTDSQVRERLGNTVRGGLEKTRDGLLSSANREYSRARRILADEPVQLRPQRAYQALSDHIDELADTGMGADGLGLLRNMQRRLESGPVSVDTLRNMRTTLRDDLISGNMLGTDAARRANEVVDAVADDLAAGLRSAGRDDAADAFAQGDRAWREMRQLEEETIERVLGRDSQRSGEEITAVLNRDLRGNGAAAAKMLNSLPEDVRGSVRATIVSRMGRATDGQQNVDGDQFSFSTFLTNYNNMDESARAAYFGREMRGALNDLAIVADGSKQAQRYRNTSNTAGAVPNPPVAADLMTLGARYWGPNVTARMLTSQRFVRWLAAAPKKPNPQAQRAHVGRLSAIARTEPLLAQSILGLQEQLLRPSVLAPLAADERAEPVGDVPPRQGGGNDGGI